MHEPERENTEKLKREIEHTRARVAADVEAIGDKISPENIKQRMKERMAEGMRHGVDTVKTSTRRAGRSLVSSARSNPLPLILVGAGIGWLIYNARENGRRDGWQEPMLDEVDYDDGGPSARERVAYMRERAGDKMHDLRERAGEKMDHVSHGVARMRERAGERLGHVREVAGERWGHAREGAEHFMQDNPLAMGAIALAVGAGVGMLIPSTRVEDRIVGERRDRLLHAGREKVETVMHEAKQVAKDAQHLAEAAAHKVAGVAKQAEPQPGSEYGKGQTVPGGADAPQQSPGAGPGEFDSTLGRRY